MTTIHITEENFRSFAIGSRVEFNYGPMHGSELGLIVDYGSNDWGFYLVAETEQGAEKRISSFNEIGIGVRLIEAA